MFEIVVARRDLLIHLASLFERSKDEVAFNLLTAWSGYLKQNRIIQTLPIEDEVQYDYSDSSWQAALRLTAQSSNNLILKNVNTLTPSAFRVYVENDIHSSVFTNLNSIAQIRISTAEIESFFKRCFISDIPRTKLFGHGFTTNSQDLAWFESFKNQTKEIFIYDRFLASNLSSIDTNVKCILNAITECDISDLRITVAFCRQNNTNPWTERELNPIANAFTEIGIRRTKLHLIPLVTVPHHDRAIFSNLNVVHSGDSFYYFNNRGTNESKGTRVSVNSLLDGHETLDALDVLSKIYDVFKKRSVLLNEPERNYSSGFADSAFYKAVMNRNHII